MTDHSETTTLGPIRLSFGNGDEEIVVHTVEELDTALDHYEHQARQDEPRIVFLNTDGDENYMYLGVGADLVPIDHKDDRPGSNPEYVHYVHGVGELPDGAPQEWAFSNTWQEVEPSSLIPASQAREAARRWLLTHERPDNVRWEGD